MSIIKRVALDPLVHFLLGGGMIFAVYALVHGADAGDEAARTIVVDRPALLKYMQYQSAAFKPDYFEAQFAAMSPAERKALIGKYVEEEALVREARAMKLDSVDYVIRQRLVQKMTYLIDDAATASATIDDAKLRAYYDAHRADYRGEATLTFTHVFIDNEVAHAGGEQAAQAMRARLEARHAAYADATGYGDRTPFLRNFVDRAPGFIANQYGQNFADAVARLEPSVHWQGPIRSDYGWHLVLVTSKTPASDPSFEEVRGQIKEEMLVDANAAYRARAIADLIKQYDVKVEGLNGK